MNDPDRAPAEPVNVAGLGELLNDRRDYLHVAVRQTDPINPINPGDSAGWDVVVRVDGTYADRDSAEHMAGHFADRLMKLLGGPVEVQR